MSKLLVSEFIKSNSKLINDCFVKEPKILDKFNSLSKLNSLKTRLGIKLLILYALLYLLLLEPEVVLYQLKLRKKGGLSGAYQFQRLYEIRRYIKSYKPKSVIEFGSGASSLLFAKYVDLVSVEESKEWLNKYKSDLDQTLFIRKSLKQKTIQSLYLCPRVESIDELQEKVSSFLLSETIRNHVFDFAYIDGPTSWEQNEDLIGLIKDPYNSIPNTSILELNSLPIVILIDGRRATISYLLRSNKFLNYQIILKGVYQKKSQAGPYHTILTRENS